MPFVRAYFRETQELVFDAHDKAFAFFGGVCRRGIYDNMKTAVEARRRQPPPPPSITTPDALRLKIEPAANCGRYDSIRKVA